MNTILRKAVRLAVHQAERPNVLRTETESQDAQRIAKEGRCLLLHDASNEDTEAWLWRLED